MAAEPRSASAKILAATTAVVMAFLFLPVLGAATIAGVVMPAAETFCDDLTGAAGSWRPPLTQRYVVTSPFGMRFHPVLKVAKLHTGIDLVALPRPGPVVAAASGKIITRGYNTAYGNQVVIDHGGGIRTRYGHMARLSALRTGQQIRAGTKLGIEGATGYVTGNHLHFEVIKNGHVIDPKPFMKSHGAPLNGKAIAATSQASAPSAAAAVTAVRSDGIKISLRGEQLTNAATIISVGQQVQVSNRGIVIALMAALQESGLRNLNYGDRDSLGLFQQRAGWGSATQRRTPVYAARAFYGGTSGPNHGSPPGLLDVSGWTSMTLGGAAQAVQVSAYPSRYAAWEPVARELLSTVGGVALAECSSPSGN